MNDLKINQKRKRGGKGEFREEKKKKKLVGTRAGSVEWRDRMAF